MVFRCGVALALATYLAAATDPREVAYEEQPALLLANDKLRLTILTQGATIASLTLADDDEQVNPLWNPFRLAREAGRKYTFDGLVGHFVALDGFGAASPQERAANVPSLGEARLQQYAVLQQTNGSLSSVTMTAILPAAVESFTRTYSVLDGENVVYVDSRLENMTSIDHPLFWTEHATFGAPYIAPGVSAIDLPGTRSMVRPASLAESALGTGAVLGRRLVAGTEFTWPITQSARNVNGSDRPVNLRNSPGNPRFLDHVTTLLDTNREFAWIVAINTFRQTICGYLFRRTDFPWVQMWGYFPSEHAEVRGVGFGLSPWDLPRRDAVTLGNLFGAPTMGWLPAKAKIEKRFLMFTAHAPDGFRRVDEVRIDKGTLVLKDLTAGKDIRLAASRVRF
jgi:hypothetical protein